MSFTNENRLTNLSSHVWLSPLIHHYVFPPFCFFLTFLYRFSFVNCKFCPYIFFHPSPFDDLCLYLRIPTNIFLILCFSLHDCTKKRHVKLISAEHGALCFGAYLFLSLSKRARMKDDNKLKVLCRDVLKKLFSSSSLRRLGPSYLL